MARLKKPSLPWACGRVRSLVEASFREAAAMRTLDRDPDGLLCAAAEVRSRGPFVPRSF